MINFIGNFSVVPSLPEKLEPLREIAYNIYWSWNQDAQELFWRLDRDLWESTNHNPVMMLGSISQEKLQEVSEDDGFLSHMNRVFLQLNIYMQDTTWYQKKHGDSDVPFIAYFSAEFGLTESLQIYSGGLGVLAGDHLKSASDLGLPLVGIGLCYKEGYFQQYLTADGWQQERYDTTDFLNMPMTLVTNDDGTALKISLDFPGRQVYMQIWKIQVGRIPLYLLDTDVPENSEEDQQITIALYGGGKDTRIQQEIVLGIGGIRALQALKINPLVCHMNEGHSAFLALERIRILTQKGLTFDQARDIGIFSNIFTTHTPVPAGIDVFGNDLVEKYFGKYYREELKISDKDFYRLATLDKNKPPANFNMAHLAMNMAGLVNGVSELHGKVSRKMWMDGFPGIPFDEIPIDFVTNGIHTRSHLSAEMNKLLARYLGDDFASGTAEKSVWDDVEDIPDEELWNTHERRRERLVSFARRRLKKQLVARGASSSEINEAKEVLNPSVLTIGFARRFATYKRASLILRDIERLLNIVNDHERPVQFIIAGKAHPQDEEGKKLIQELVATAKEPAFRKRIVFLENYDMNIARYMVEGCDIWLNNPTRPLEASGTSGMKIIANGGLNFSILDGWWDEAYHPDYGWKIGNGEEYENVEYQNEVESRLIYETLEKEIVKTFYERGEDRLPRKWIYMMKQSMKNLGAEFNTNRMVSQYTENFYMKALERRKMIMEKDWTEAKNYSKWKKNLFRNWKNIKFISISEENEKSEMKVDTTYKLISEIDLGKLTPDDVEIQIYFGKVDDKYDTNANDFVTMNFVKTNKDVNIHMFEGEIKCKTTGHFGYTLRALPKHKLLHNPFELNLIHWA
ncbi:MAG: glycosyltransferase family 1 protein [Ignavibacteriae bacterium]|nr:glycosyltransferase family 1 protein [Ignavibacteriota bacterium]